MDGLTIAKWLVIVVSIIYFICLAVYLAFAIYYFNKARSSTLTANQSRYMFGFGIVALVFLFLLLIAIIIVMIIMWKEHSDTKDMHAAHMETHKNATLVPNSKLASLKPTMQTYTTETCYPHMTESVNKPKVVVKGTTVPEDQVYCLVPMSEKCASLFGNSSSQVQTETMPVPHTHTHPTKISFSDWE